MKFPIFISFLFDLIIRSFYFNFMILDLISFYGNNSLISKVVRTLYFFLKRLSNESQ
jgi:hypothetical protein